MCKPGYCRVANVSVMHAYISTICYSSKTLFDRVDLRGKNLRSRGVDFHFLLRFTHYLFCTRLCEFVAKHGSGDGCKWRVSR